MGSVFRLSFTPSVLVTPSGCCSRHLGQPFDERPWRNLGTQLPLIWQRLRRCDDNSRRKPARGATMTVVQRRGEGVGDGSGTPSWLSQSKHAPRRAGPRLRLWLPIASQAAICG